MGFLGLLITLYIILVSSPFGGKLEEWTGISALVFFFIGSGLVALGTYFFSDIMAGMIVRRMTGWGGDRIDSRRRIGRGVIQKTRREKKLEQMSEAELEAFIRKHPDNALAAELKCERLRAAGDQREYALATEDFLKLKSELELEEKCALYNELADLYALELDDPIRARVVLQKLIAEFPTSYQATLARTRLREMDDEPQETW